MKKNKDIDFSLHHESKKIELGYERKQPQGWQAALYPHSRFLAAQYQTDRPPYGMAFVGMANIFRRVSFSLKEEGQPDRLITAHVIVGPKDQEKYENIYAYRIQKIRRQARLRATGAQIVPAVYFGQTYTSAWEIQIYRIPVDEIAEFEQHKAGFKLVTRAQRDLGKPAPYGKRKENQVLPKKTSNGWMLGEALEDTMSDIARTIRTGNQSWLYAASTKYITVRIDRRDGNFIICDQNGNLIEDPETLMNVLYGTIPSHHPISKESQ